MEKDQLYENINVRQREDEGYRRWFVNSYFDLIIWYIKKDGDLLGLQLCYSRNKWERVFTWTNEFTSSHLVSDTFMEQDVCSQSTGILKGDGGVIPENVLNKFIEESEKVDEDLKCLIINKINIYNQSRKSKIDRVQSSSQFDISTVTESSKLLCCFC